MRKHIRLDHYITILQSSYYPNRDDEVISVEGREAVAHTEHGGCAEHQRRFTYNTFILELQILIAPISVKKHNVVDWYISYFSVLCEISFVRYNECFFDMIIFVLNKCVQCAMHGMLFNERFYLTI